MEPHQELSDTKRNDFQYMLTMKSKVHVSQIIKGKDFLKLCKDMIS